MPSNRSQGPLVSVLIPCYNSAAYLAEAIDSALNQTHTNIEVVVVDDGSADDCESILNAYEERIRWRRISNSGACVARNVALSMAEGEYVQFLDADDVLLPKKIERQLPLFERYDADLVFCGSSTFGDVKPKHDKKSRYRPLREDEDPFAFALRQSLSTHAPLHRIECVRNIDGFTPDLPCAQEFDLHVRLAAAGGRFVFMDESLVKIRVHNSPYRISRQKRTGEPVLEIVSNLGKTLQNDPRYHLTETRKTALANLLGQHAAHAFRNGNRHVAKLAFQQATLFDPNFKFPERPWYQLAARCLGHFNTERLLSAVRNMRDSLRPA